MNQKFHHSIQPVVCLIYGLMCSSLNIGLRTTIAFSAESQQNLTQLPTEVIEGVSRTTLAQMISSDHRFTILRTVLRTTGLLNQLQQGESLTLFAPTDAAFKALPDQVLTTLMQPENINQLTNLLKYHLVSAQVSATELSSGKIESVQGSLLQVEVNSDQVRVGDATVIEPDIQASNEVIHVIDQVMILPE